MSDLVFSAAGSWLAATSSHGTTHLFSLSSDQFAASGGPAGSGVATQTRDDRDESVAVAPPPHPPSGGADAAAAGDGVFTGLASRVGAALGLRAAPPSLPSATGVPATGALPVTLSQDSYLAGWAQVQARMGGAVVRGPCCRMRHATAALGSTGGRREAPSAHAVPGGAPGAETPAPAAGSGADSAAAAGGVTGGASAGAGEAVAPTHSPPPAVNLSAELTHPSMCSAVFNGTSSQRLVAVSRGLLSVYTLRVDARYTAAAAGGAKVATHSQAGVWDLRRRSDWEEVHHRAAVLPASERGCEDASPEGMTRTPSNVTEEVRWVAPVCVVSCVLCACSCNVMWVGN